MAHHLTIGEVAARVGLRPSAIRYYEGEGLVPTADRRGGKRIYEASILDRLTLIELAKGAGFTIREIQGLLTVFGRRRPAAASWKKLARTKLDELDAQIMRATRMKDLLGMLIHCACPTLDDCGRALEGALPITLRPRRRGSAGVLLQRAPRATIRRP